MAQAKSVVRFYREDGWLLIMGVHGSSCGSKEALLLEASRSPGADLELRVARGISEQASPALGVASWTGLVVAVLGNIDAPCSFGRGELNLVSSCYSCVPLHP